MIDARPLCSKRGFSAGSASLPPDRLRDSRLRVRELLWLSTAHQASQRREEQARGAELQAPAGGEPRVAGG